MTIKKRAKCVKIKGLGEFLINLYLEVCMPKKKKKAKEGKKYGVLTPDTYFPGLDTMVEARKHFKEKGGIAIIEQEDAIPAKKMCSEHYG